MAEPSSRRKRGNNEGLGALNKKKPKPEPEKNKFMFRVLLPNGLNLTLELEDASQDMSVAEFVRTVRRKAETEVTEKGSRKIHWGPQVYVEDAMGERIEDGNIICQTSHNKTMIVALQDGGINSVHTYQDMWNVTPEPHLLVELPQEYTFETALADLIDNSLQAVWANGPGERRLISVNLQDGEVSIFDSGQGMDSSKENSIAKWGTMGSSNHRAVRGSAIGLKPPYLKPYFGMYGFGGLAASMHLGGLVMVSSKTKMSKKVVTLKLEKDTLVQKSKADRIWRTAGDIREVSQEERDMSPHGSFTKVHISKLKSNYWNEDQLKCMLKDIYFPYIQNDGFDESIRTSTPVEFEVNGMNLTEVAGGEVVATNLSACNGPPFVLELHLRKKQESQGHAKSGNPDANRSAEQSANAKLTCFYFPILQGKESVDTILDKLEAEGSRAGESFETFCRVSIRRLGRLLPDARWGRLPFMEPKRKRGENVQVPQHCFKRVKCFVESDAGFAPTTSKTDLAHKHPFTLVLKNLGRKPDISDPAICMEIERDGKQITPVQLEKEYQEWLRAMHESYDEEVECGDEEATLILNPSNGKDLGISHNVIRVLTQIKRKGYLWKASQKIKILKGAADPRKDLYATLEYILCEGLDGDPGEARMICRPMECPEAEGSKLLFNNGNASFELGSSRSLPLDLISSGKCQALDEDTWKRQAERKRLKTPAFIDVLHTDQVLKFDVDKGFPKGETVQAGFVLPKEIIAVVRPHAFKGDNMTSKSSDDLDQKSVVKDNMEMKMDIQVSSQDDSAQDSSPTSDVKFSMQTKACSRNGIHGLYSFRMEGSRLNEMFEKAGRYRFIFSLVNNPYANLMPAEVDLFVEASERVGKWKLSFQLSDTESTEIKRPNVRLGSEIGPLYISCYDVYSNRMAFKSYPQLEVHVHKMGTPVKIKIEKASGCITQDRMYLQISKILLGGGKLDELRPSFEASLRVGSKDSCFVEIPLAVLPGDMCSVKLSNAELDNCLRPGDVIHKLKLQVLDAYDNPVEKGRKIKVELTGLEFQDQEFQDQDDPYREVDDQGWVNFGGLLKVTGKYGSKGCIRVSSDTQNLLIKEFDLLSRKLQVISGIPEHSCAGSILKNVVFGIFDDEGNIDTKMNGCQHTLTVDLCTMSSVQYTFVQGKCTVPILELPEDIGLLEFKAFHSWHTELFVHMKVDMLPNPRLEMVSVPEQPLDDGTVCHAYDESTTSQPHTHNQIMVHEVKSYIEAFMIEMTKWEDELKQLGTKVKRREDELNKLENNKSTVNNSLSDLERELGKCTFSSKCDGKGLPSQGSHTVEDTLEEIKRQGTTAAALWVHLSRRGAQSKDPRAIPIPIIEDVVGIVALLGKVEDDVLSWALSEYLGRENMLAVVCKSGAGVEALEQYDESGNVKTRTGIHGLATAQNAKVNGRFRVICLKDIRSYEGGFKVGDPQKQLIMEDPKLSDGNLPEGYMGYAVNMIKLDHEELCPSSSSVTGLRGTLFFNLFSYLQVYRTRNHLKQAIPYIRDGAISLDGGMIRGKGVIECGNRDKVAVRFPTTSAKTSPTTSAKTSPFNSGKIMPSLFHLRDDLEEKIAQKKDEKELLEKQINRARDKLECLKKKFENKKKELVERENRKNMFLENVQQQGFFLENHEHSD